jgi:hypothetical protein
MILLTTEERKWNSSLITSSQWTPDYNHLDISFASGASYRYAEVPEDVYEAFCTADSQGSYFNKNIKGKYPFTKIEKEETDEKDGDTQSN